MSSICQFVVPQFKNQFGKKASTNPSTPALYLMVKEGVNFPLRNKASMCTLSAPIQHNAGSSSRSNKAKRGNKGQTYQKERNKTLTIWDDMIVNPENPKESCIIKT